MNFMTEQDGQTTGDGAEHTEEGESAYVSEEKKQQVSGATLGLFGLVLACGAAVYFMYLRPGPQSAEAADTAAQTAINEFLVSGEQHMTLMRELLKNTDKVVERFHQYPTKTQVPLASLAKNPFRQTVGGVVAPDTESADAARRRLEEERQQITEAVRKIQLQSILYGGGRQACMMNGKMYRQGDEVEGFAIEEIGPSSVIVRKNGVGFRLSMKR